MCTIGDAAVGVVVVGGGGGGLLKFVGLFKRNNLPRAKLLPTSGNVPLNAGRIEKWGDNGVCCCCVVALVDDDVDDGCVVVEPGGGGGG